MSAPVERLPLSAPLVPLTLWPSAQAHAPVLLVVPALGTPAGAYKRLAAALAERCAEVAVLELRGVGESGLRASRRADWSYADLVDGEVDQAIAALRQRYPGRPLLLLGHSLGGHLALLHQARHPQRPIDGLVLVASGAPYARAYGGKRLLVRLFGSLAHWSSKLLGYFPGDWLGFGGRQGRTLMVEWARFVRTGQMQVSTWPDPQVWRPRLKQVEVPALALATEGDHYAPVAAMRHLLALSSIPSEVERVRAGPDGQPPGHFRWLKQPAETVARISAWVLALAREGRRVAA